MFQQIHAAIAHHPSAVEGTEPQEITAPVVFQCAKCHLIVGDSLTFANADETTQSITLSGKCVCVSN